MKIYKALYFGMSGETQSTQMIEANNKEEAKRIAHMVASKEFPEVYYSEIAIVDFKTWKMEDFKDYNEYKDIGETVVYFLYGGKKSFSSNKEAVEYLNDECITYNFATNTLLKNNNLIGFVYGEHDLVDYKTITKYKIE